MSKLETDDSMGKVTHTLDNQSSLDKGLVAKRDAICWRRKTTSRDIETKPAMYLLPPDVMLKSSV